MRLEGFVHVDGESREAVKVMRIETRGVWFVHEAHNRPGRFCVTHEPSGARMAGFDGGESGMRKALGFMRALPDDMCPGLAWGGVGINASDYLRMKRAHKAASLVHKPDPKDESSRSVRDELRASTRWAS